MIQISILQKEQAPYKSNLITSNIGEITRIEDNSFNGCELDFYDSKGPSFGTTTKWSAVRYFSLCTITNNTERSDLIPQKYKADGRLTFINCNDPRVIWACIISLWITNKIPKKKRLNKKSRSKVLTELLPTYEDSSIWLIKNRFKLFATKEDENTKNDPYLNDYSALVTPPDIDWSIFPNAN